MTEQYSAANQPFGNVSALPARPFLVDGKRHTFYGNPVDLSIRAHALGVRPGDKVSADYGCGFKDYIMEATGGGDRTPDGVWVTEERWPNGCTKSAYFEDGSPRYPLKPRVRA